MAIYSRLRQAQQALTQAQKRLARLEAYEPGSIEVQQTQRSVATHEAERKRWQEVHSAYRQHLGNLSLLLHPWCLVNSTRQTSNKVECRLQAEIEALASLVEQQGLPTKPNTLAKVCKQLAGISALIDFWWQTVEHDLEQMAMTAR